MSVDSRSLVVRYHESGKNLIDVGMKTDRTLINVPYPFVQPDSVEYSIWLPESVTEVSPEISRSNL